MSKSYLKSQTLEGLGVWGDGVAIASKGYGLCGLRPAT